MSNFLALPTKRAVPIADLGPKLLSYITAHFRDAHPEAFRRDVDQFVGMRREWVDGKGEAHPEGVKGLIRYHAQLAFLVTKFPSDIGVQFAYHLPFPPPFSMTPDAAISQTSLTYERASVLYNIAALYGTMAATERRADLEGIKRALGYLTAAAGILNYLITSILPTLRNELLTPNAAGFDMTDSFLTAMREFMLAQAQECFWQQAVMQGSYKDPIVAKLSMKVSEYYKSALSSAKSLEYPSIAFLPANWTAHITVKQLHFEAAAQWRMSRDDLGKSKYGEEIARLKLAESLAKKGLNSTRGVGESVISDLRDLHGAVKSALERAVKDNDLIYLSPIPPANQLPALQGAAMVKLSTPPEIAEPVEWLMKNGSAGGPLFSALVPYGVHLALSVYDDRKDTLVRELDSKREELDGLAASTLQSLNLPGTIQALDRPVGLPPSLLKKAEDVDSGGGVRRIESLLEEVGRLSRANTKSLEEAMDILDDEATENEQLLQREPHLAHSRTPSHIANRSLIDTAGQYDNTLKAAKSSDQVIRQKWEDWESRITILAGDQDDLSDHIPSTSSSSTLPTSVRPLRASLEELDDRIAHRASLMQEAKSISSSDDVRSEIMSEASKRAHAGSQDVRPEWFEGVFEKGLSKYDRAQNEMRKETALQEKLLEDIRTQNDAFLRERKDDPRVKARETALQEMDAAYWKWKELIDNLEEGIKFYNNLSGILSMFKNTCMGFLNSRRSDVGQISQGVQGMSLSSYPEQSQHNHYDHQSQDYHHQPHYSPPQSFSPPPSHQSRSPPKPFGLPHPSSSNWVSGNDLLPPPPPQPILRSGGIPQQPQINKRTSSTTMTPGYSSGNAGDVTDSPRRVTRSQGKAIGNPEVNPYRGNSGSRRDGGVV